MRYKEKYVLLILSQSLKFELNKNLKIKSSKQSINKNYKFYTIKHILTSYRYAKFLFKKWAYITMKDILIIFSNNKDFI